ncbi:MAG: hypothetical protein C0482_05070 [Gordonia sp.]|nr:hypothetical protein [Gordonia sp. (in: high G+C Gram-positive bacteria)]
MIDRTLLAEATRLSLELGLSVTHELALLSGGALGESDESGLSNRAEVIRLQRASVRPPLFSYQRDLSIRMFDNAADGTDALLSLPTGGGKTRTAVSACLDLMAGLDYKRIVWLAPTMELTSQALTTFRAMWLIHGAAPDMNLRESFTDDADRHVWITTPQAVIQRIRRKRSLGRVDFVVFDEAHQAVARTFAEVLEALQSSPSNIRRPSIIGLSATPGRVNEDETRALSRLFQGRLLTSPTLGKDPIRTLQRMGVLSKLVFRSLSPPSKDSNNETDRIRGGIELCVQLASRGKHVLVFTQSVAGAVCMAAALESRGVRSSAVFSDLSQTERVNRIEMFASKNIQVLTNQRLLATGYDCPAVTDVVLLSRIGSPILFEQMVGRAARGPKTGGATKSTVWQFDDHLALHGMPASYYRYTDYFVDR